MCIVGDEVGGNASQKGDDRIVGTLYLCERHHIPLSKTSNKDKRVTLMGLTTHTGKPLIYCVIFKVVKYCVDTKLELTLLSRLIEFLTLNKIFLICNV